MNDLILFVDHSDLYFMVQWFCLVSLTLSHRKDIILKKSLQSETVNDLIHFEGLFDLYFMVPLMSSVL